MGFAHGIVRFTGTRPVLSVSSYVSKGFGTYSSPYLDPRESVSLLLEAGYSLLKTILCTDGTLRLGLVLTLVLCAETTMVYS